MFAWTNAKLRAASEASCFYSVAMILDAGNLTTPSCQYVASPLGSSYLTNGFKGLYTP